MLALRNQVNMGEGGQLLLDHGTRKAVRERAWKISLASLAVSILLMGVIMLIRPPENPENPNPDEPPMELVTAPPSQRPRPRIFGRFWTSTEGKRPPLVEETIAMAPVQTLAGIVQEGQG